MTKARTNASATPAVGRNMIINGGMNISQRSTSTAAQGADSSTNLPSVDRFKHFNAGSSAGRYTSSQTADGPNGISANCLKILCTTADTSIAAGERFDIFQLIEGQNVQRIGKGVVGAKQVTVSFYVKASGAFTFGLELFDNNNRQITKLFDTTTAWNRIELTFPADVDDGSSPFDDNNLAALQVGFWLHAGATYAGGTLNTAAWNNYTNANRAAGIDSIYSAENNAIYLTGLQVEVGPVASDFEQEDIGFTKSKCQRYYYAHQTINSGLGSNSFMALSYASNAIYGVIKFPVQMRSNPAVTSGGTWHARASNNVSLTANFGIQRVGRNSITIAQGSAGTASANSAFWVESQGATAHIAFKSEL